MTDTSTPIGICAWGRHIPRRRLPLPLLTGSAVSENAPEKAVAGYDEDSVTLAVAAARDCLGDGERGSVGLLLLASTTAPYAEKQSAAIVARALGLPPTVRTVDIGGSTRAGTDALLQGIDAVAAGSVDYALVIAADCRRAAPETELDARLGDAAAAFLVGRGEPVLARLLAAHYNVDSLLDRWRTPDDPFVHSWEDRFVHLHGYRGPVEGAVRALLEQRGGAVNHFACPAPDARSHKALSAALGFDRSAVVDPLFGRVGDCGAAFAPLVLSVALERAGPGQRIVAGDYGDGAAALLLETTGAMPAPDTQTLQAQLDSRQCIDNYRSYLRSCELLPREYPAVPGPGISATVHYRERREDLTLEGQVCECGEHQFPKGRICRRCGAQDRFQPARYADCRGRVLSFTHDAFFPSPEPPTTAAIVEVDGGPRIHMQWADAPADAIEVGTEVRFVFRCIHHSGGKPNYFWKCAPVDEVTL